MLSYKTDEIQHVERFIESHESLLNTTVKKGVFGAGVSTALLLQVQEKKYRKKTPPFWDKLGRLDLTLEKVGALPIQVKSLLAKYNIRYFDTTINYLMANYPLEQTPVEEPLRRETVSYLFTLGLSFGYFVARKYIQKESGEEVNNENGENNNNYTTTQSDNQ